MTGNKKKSKFAVLQVLRYLSSEPHSLLFITEQKGGISANGGSPDTSIVLLGMMHSDEVVPTVGYITTEEARARCLE